MRIKLIAVVLAAVLATAGVMAFSNQSPSSTNEASTVSAAATDTTKPQANTGVYLDDFKAGYADGFGAGVANFAYPDQSSMASNTRGYLEGFGQGFEDGQGQQASLRAELCSNPRVSGVTGAFPEYGTPRYAGSRFASTGRSVSTGRSSFSSGTVESRRVDRGIGTTARRAMLIGGGAAAGAGLGGAVGGKKGALIGALVGGGTGTVLAVKKKPTRAFDRRISKKSVILNTLLGAGAGAGIGALAGGKRGALAGAGIGGGGGAIYTLMTGRSTRR